MKNYWVWLLIDLICAVVTGTAFALIATIIGLGQYESFFIIVGVFLSGLIMNPYKPYKKKK